MPNSAFLGQQPVSYNDELIYKGLLEVSPSFFEEVSKLPRVSHHSKASSMIIGSSFAVAIAITVTCSRLWVRKFRSRTFGADDVVIIPASIGCVAYLAITIASERAGCLGKHAYNCTYEEFGWFYELAHCNFSIFYATVFLIKISIALANRRITGMTSKRWQIAHWIYLALLMSILPICVLLNLFPCSPIAVSFTLQAIAKVPDPRTIKCLDTDAISLATRSLHIVTDLLLLPVPIIIVWRLQMRLSRKVRLMLVFCVGIVSSIASIMRNILTSRIASDLTYDYYQLYAWDVIDIFFATIVASLPVLNGLVDEGIAKAKALGLKSNFSILNRFRSFGIPPQGNDEYDTRLSDKGIDKVFKSSFGALGGKQKLRNASDQFNEPILRHEADIELQRFGEDSVHQTTL